MRPRTASRGSLYPAVALAWQECTRRLTELAALAPLAGADSDPDGAVAALAADQETPWRLPRLYELAGHFAGLGLGPLLDEIAPLAGDATAAASLDTGAPGRADHGLSAPDLAAAAFDWAWYRAMLDQIRVRDPDYAARRGQSPCRRGPRRAGQRLPPLRRRAPGRQPVTGPRRVGAAAARDRVPASAAGPGDPQAGGAAPRAPGAAAAARPGRRRAVRAQAVLGDVTADGQPGTAARPAVRPGDLRRGQPGRARRRDRLDYQGAPGGGGGRRQAAAADQLLPPGRPRRPRRRR